MPNLNGPTNDANLANGDSASSTDFPKHSIASSDSLADLPQRRSFPGKCQSAIEEIVARFSAATDISVTAGSNTVTQSIVWAPTDIVTASAGIHVRAGDSLLLTCTGTGDVLEIDDNYDSDNSVFTSTFTGAPG